MTTVCRAEGVIQGKVREDQGGRGLWRLQTLNQLLYSKSEEETVRRREERRNSEERREQGEGKRRNRKERKDEERKGEEIGQ